MYITNTSKEVISFFDNLLNESDITKLKILIYLFNELNNNQINNMNEVNPNLVDDEDIIIFNLDLLGLSNNLADLILQHLQSTYNKLVGSAYAYYDSGNILGIKYSLREKEILSQFEKLKYNDKLDVFREIFIRYGNDTYFNCFIYSYQVDGFQIAYLIPKCKE